MTVCGKCGSTFTGESCPCGFRGVQALNLSPLEIKGTVDRGVPQPDKTPYPNCMGNPTYQDCIEAGYCKRDPNCGE